MRVYGTPVRGKIPGCNGRNKVENSRAINANSSVAERDICKVYRSVPIRPKSHLPDAKGCRAGNGDCLIDREISVRKFRFVCGARNREVEYLEAFPVKKYLLSICRERVFVKNDIIFFGRYLTVKLGA